MIKRFFTTDTIRIPCLFRQGILFFLLAAVTAVIAEPSIGLSVKKEGEMFTYTVIGIDIKDAKKSSIICKYDSSANIDKAAIGTLKSSLALGASLDRINHLLCITLSPTGVLTIDSTALVLIKVPAANTEKNPVMILQSAAITDKLGTTFNPKLLNVTNISYDKQFRKPSITRSNSFGFFLLNGTMLPGKTTGDILDIRKKAIPVQFVNR